MQASGGVWACQLWPCLHKSRKSTEPRQGSIRQEIKRSRRAGLPSRAQLTRLAVSPLPPNSLNSRQQMKKYVASSQRSKIPKVKNKIGGDRTAGCQWRGRQRWRICTHVAFNDCSPVCTLAITAGRSLTPTLSLTLADDIDGVKVLSLARRRHQASVFV